MIKRQIFVGVIFVLFLAGIVFGGLKTEIRYQTSELGAGHWQYSYDVTNISLTAPIKEFTIWFEFGLYENLAIQTPDPPEEQYTFDLDTDQRIMAQSDRMSVYAGEGVRLSQL